MADELEPVENDLDELLPPSVPAMVAVARAEIDTQIATARAYPRSLKRFRETATTMATLDEKTAASCFYALPRGGKSIMGPSARLAEIDRKSVV